jgi:hypothetical protein
MLHLIKMWLEAPVEEISACLDGPIRRPLWAALTMNDAIAKSPEIRLEDADSFLMAEGTTAVSR